jgi:hypothetical protein
MKWDILKFADAVDRERRRVELSGIEGSDAVGALLREIVSVVNEAEKGAPIPTWMTEKQPEFEAEHSRRMRATIGRMWP